MEKVLNNIITTGSKEKKVFFVLISILLVLAMCYAYFVNKTVLNIVARKNIQEEISVLSSDISGLEFDYMKYKNTITLGYTHDLGFNDVKNTTFITRGTSDTRLTLQE
jgi:hypothetical protein